MLPLTSHTPFHIRFGDYWTPHHPSTQQSGERNGEQELRLPRVLQALHLEKRVILPPGHGTHQEVPVRNVWDGLREQLHAPSTHRHGPSENQESQMSGLFKELHFEVRFEKTHELCTRES